MTLDQSIKRILSLWPLTMTEPDSWNQALRQFAEAIREDLSTSLSPFPCGCRTCVAHAKPPEPKECIDHGITPYCFCSMQKPHELPKSVREMIDTICHEHASIYLAPELQTLARLCFEIASRGRG